jgi:nitrite reductase/ring-hydroxylating ferredoxin subunit
MPTKIELCNASDVDVGAVLKVEKDDLTLAVFNFEGEFFVTDDHCTHGPGSLSEGFVEGDVVECNFHGGQFNIRTGGRAALHGSDQDLSDRRRRWEGLHRGVSRERLCPGRMRQLRCRVEHHSNRLCVAKHVHVGLFARGMICQAVG